ncbi:embryonic protein UVS.2-like [Tachypleus tridentatus]|uniref:embryonic protein UVS.2-like n=1 Tax=Tachypleus tridentatus TaxID=6853 RepID=UPI003FD42DFB
MFRQVLWLAFLFLTWSGGYFYIINATEGQNIDTGIGNGSDPILMPIEDGTDSAVDNTYPVDEPAETLTNVSALDNEFNDQLTTLIYQDDTLMSDCYITTQSQLTVIKSTSFPNNYGPNLDCLYTVRRNSSRWCSVTFLFNVLDLEASDGCTKDYVELAGERLCGYNPSGVTRIIEFDDSEISMKFHSDNEVTGLGFLLTAVQQECPPPSCDRRFTEPQFKLSSPDFPSNYDNRRICDYVILKSSTTVCKLRLQVELFDVEYDDKCEADFFELDGEKFCGIMSEGQIVEMDFPNSEMMGRFRSDYATSRTGYLFEVTQIECPSEILLTNQTNVKEISEELSSNQGTEGITPSVTEMNQVTIEVKTATQENIEVETPNED